MDGWGIEQKEGGKMGTKKGRGGHGYTYVSAGNEKTWLPTELIKIRSEQRKPLNS